MLKKKKLLSIALSAFLLLSLLPGSGLVATAKDSSNNVTFNVNASIGQEGGRALSMSDLPIEPSGKSFIQNPTTFTNPISLTQGSERVLTSGEPVVKIFKDDYYLFIRGRRGYWWSHDFVDWTYVDAPNLLGGIVGITEIDGKLYNYAGNTENRVRATDDPKTGIWYDVGTFSSNNYGDASMLYDEESGRLFMYYGWSQLLGIRVVELDKTTFKEIGKPVVCIWGDPHNHGWETRYSDDLIFPYFSHREYRPQEYGWTEGGHPLKYKGKYYLMYASIGLEFFSYGHGVYVADDPLGPYVYSEHNPLTMKTTGVAPGAGHGSIFLDKQGKVWTICMLPYALNGGRGNTLISLFPSDVDAEGVMHGKVEYGDYPQYLPGVKADPIKDNFTGWMLLTLDKQVETSSTLENYWPALAVDEDPKSYWSAKTGDPGEYMTVDIGKVSDIRGIQVLWDRAGATGTQALDRYQSYTVEVSDDNRNWTLIIDKSNNPQDLRTDYIELPAGVKGRYVKLTNKFTPDGGRFAVKALRAFGNPEAATFTKVANVKAVRSKLDRRNAHLLWDQVDGADGYVVRYGIEPNKLYNSYTVYWDNYLNIRSLNVGPEYYFEVEAFSSGTPRYVENTFETRGRGAELDLVKQPTGGATSTERIMTYETYGKDEVYVFNNISPGAYTLNHTFGVGIWGPVQLTEDQLIGTGTQPTVTALDLTQFGIGSTRWGTVEVRVYPGATSGRIEVTFKYDTASSLSAYDVNVDNVTGDNVNIDATQPNAPVTASGDDLGQVSITQGGEAGGSQSAVRAMAMSDLPITPSGKSFIHNPTTFTNPISLTQGSERVFRGGEPVIKIFNDDYYLFVSFRLGYWWSHDFVEWTYVDAPNLPVGIIGATEIDGKLYAYAGNNNPQVRVTDDPKTGIWYDAGTFSSNNYGDASMLYDKESGRLFMYYGWSQLLGIRVVELDKTTFKEIGKPVVCIWGDPHNHGWETRYADDNIFPLFSHREYRPQEYGWTEGGHPLKYNGKYYLMYASIGLEFFSYGHGVYVADDPLGPYVYSEHNPLTMKTTGVAPGAGHGSIFLDRQGKVWTICMLPYALNGGSGDTLISLYPSDVDAEGVMHGKVEFGDYPQYLPGVKTDPIKDNFTGWTLLTLDKQVETSSTLENYWPAFAVDEDPKSYWSAKTGNPGEYMTVDIGKVSDIRGIQVLWDRAGGTIPGWGTPALTRYQSYTVEVSDDNRNWTLIIDKSNNPQDLRSDYIELPAGVRGRYVKLTNKFTPDGGRFVVKALRAFGNPENATFTKVANVKAVRSKLDRRNAHLLWDQVDGADGYVVRYGIAPNKLYNSYMVYWDNYLDIRSLNVGPEYYFEVEAFSSGTPRYVENTFETRGRGAELDLIKQPTEGARSTERIMTYETYGKDEVYVFNNISPGAYTLNHTFGVGIWGPVQLTEDQLIGTGTQPTVTALDLTQFGIGSTRWGTVEVRVYPGVTNGRIEVTFKYDTKPAITTTGLPNGTVGTAYNQTLAATGITPVTWSAEGLPGWFTIGTTTGAISGTPTTAGSFTFTVKASNAAGEVTKSFSLIISSSGGSGSGANPGPGSGSGSVPGGSPGGSPASSQGSSTSTSPSVTQPSGSTNTQGGFTDAVSISGWAKAYIDRLVQEGVLSGYSDGSLKPAGNVTRAEFTKMITTALKLSGGGATKTFSDVGAGDWFKQYVDIASSLGIINGVSDTAFAPNVNISRQDLSTIVYRAITGLGLTVPSYTGVPFPDDAQIAAYAKDAVYGLKQIGVISGRDTGAFDPGAFATREETAKIICEVEDFIQKASAASTADAASSGEAASTADTASISGETETDDEATSGSAIQSA